MMNSKRQMKEYGNRSPANITNLAEVRKKRESDTDPPQESVTHQLMEVNRHLGKIEGLLEQQIDFMANEKEKKKTEKKKGSFAADFLFYSLLVFGVFVAFMISQSNQNAASILGYRSFNVLSGSMEDVYPKGTMVIIKEVPTDELQVGDDISFFLDADTLVTHRIVDIVENYDDTGVTGFVTQGTNNTQPDGVCHPNNILGKVIFSIPKAGAYIDFLTQHLWYVGIAYGGVMILLFCFKIIFSPSEEPKKNKNVTKMKMKKNRKKNNKGEKLWTKRK